MVGILNHRVNVIVPVEVIFEIFEIFSLYRGNSGKCILANQKTAVNRPFAPVGASRKSILISIFGGE